MSKDRDLDERELDRISGGGEGQVQNPETGGTRTTPEDPPIGGGGGPSGADTGPGSHLEEG